MMAEGYTESALRPRPDEQVRGRALQIRLLARRHYALCLVPAVFFAFNIWLHSALSFYYIGLLDPSYAYYMNMIRVCIQFWPGLVEHPGIPLEMLGGATLFLSSFFVEVPCPDAECAAVYFSAHSEFFIWLIYVLTQVIFLICFIFFGLSVAQASRHLYIAIAAQLFLAAMPSTTYALFPLAPETLLLSLGLVIAGLAAPALARPSAPIRHPLALGAAISTAVFTKFTAFPYGFLIFFVGGKRRFLLSIFGLVALTAIWLPLLFYRLDLLTSFYTRFIRGSGMYGYLGGAGGGSFWDLFVGNAYALMIQMPIEIISVAILAIAIVVAGFTKHRIPLLVATVLVICLVSLATMIRQPVPRYFVPMLPLVALGLTWLMGELRPQSPSNVAIALSRRIVLPAILALVGANTFASIASWASEVASQHVDTLAFEREISLQGDCYLMRSDDQLTGIFFGSSWARSDWIKSVLDKNYPNFIIYNHNGSRLLSDFSGALTPEKIEGKIKSLGKGLCGVFNDAWTAKLDVDFYEILGHRNGLTGVRVREPIAP